MERIMSLLGLVAMMVLAWLLSSDRRCIPWRVIISGVLLQLGLAFLILGIPALGIAGVCRPVFNMANRALVGLIGFSETGARFVLGGLADSQGGVGFIFAFQILPALVFLSSLSAVAYHWKVLPAIVNGIAWLMQRCMGTSGAETLVVAANVFMGQCEAPLFIRPYLAGLTRSEMFTLMVAGMATVSGAIMATYVVILQTHIPDIAGHLLTASLLSAPAALVIAKLMSPEQEQPQTIGKACVVIPQRSVNTLDAAAIGAMEGTKLAVCVAALLVSIIAMVAMLNAGLETLGGWISFEEWGQALVPSSMLQEGSAQLSLQLVFGWVFAPLAFLMGVPWSDAAVAGGLLGEKMVLNEMVAYLHLSQIADQIQPRTQLIISYALCGFANFGSIAILVGGIGALVPERRALLSQLGIRTMIGGSLAAFMTACVAGILL